jgi:hypothetical protein
MKNVKKIETYLKEGPDRYRSVDGGPDNGGNDPPKKSGGGILS